MPVHLYLCVRCLLLVACCLLLACCLCLYPHWALGSWSLVALGVGVNSPLRLCLGLGVSFFQLSEKGKSAFPLRRLICGIQLHTHAPSFQLNFMVDGGSLFSFPAL